VGDHLPLDVRDLGQGVSLQTEERNAIVLISDPETVIGESHIHGVPNRVVG